MTLNSRPDAGIASSTEGPLEGSAHSAHPVACACGTESAFLQHAINVLEDLFYVFDGEGRMLRWNQQYRPVTGYSDEDIASMRPVDFFAPDHRERVARAIEAVYEHGEAIVEADILTKGGERIPYEHTGSLLRDSSGKVLGICGIGRDITERKQAELFQEAHGKLLEMITTGASLQEVLAELLHFIEQQHAGRARGSVLLVDQETRRLRHAAAPNLPHAYTEAIDGVEIGPDVGSCGAAAFAGAPVCASNIEEDLRWSAFKDLALQHGLRACYSVPILDAEEGVLGTLALYYDEPYPPVDEVHELITGAARLASIAMVRVRSREALSGSEARHRALVAGVPDLIFRVAGDGTYLDVHAPVSEQHHLTVRPEEFLGRRVKDVLEPAVATQIMQTIREALVDGKMHPVEYSLTVHSGQLRHFEARVTALGPSEVLAVVRDVTARIEADKERRASEARYRLIFERSPEAIVIHRGAEIIDANAAAARLAGLPAPDVLIGRSLLEFALPHQRDVARERIAALEEGRPVPLIELTVRPAVGSEKIVETLSVPVTWGGRPASQTVLRDITEHKHVEATLRKQALLFEHAHDAIAITDPAGCIVDWNPAAEELFGYAREEVIGRRTTFLHPDPQQAKETVRHIEGKEEHWRGEMPFVRKDGTMGCCETFIAPLYSEDGEFFGRMGINRDITRQRAYEQGLVEAKEQAEEARREAEEMARLKDNFLANMSHEVRTPLTSIIGFAEVLGEEVPASERELVTIIRESAERLHETLSSVLDLAQLESQAVGLRLSDVDVASEVRDVGLLLRSQAQTRGLDLHVEVPPGPVPAQVDRRALHRILVNLVSNAIKFTEEGYVRLALHQRPSTLELVVEDTGIGMDPARLPQLFEAFRQESEGTTREYEGAGLGLAITARLVGLMGGSIDVTTARGAGSSFRVSLPDAKSAAPEEPEADDRLPAAPSESAAMRDGRAANTGASSDGLEARRPSVLLVEDTAVVHELVRRVLDSTCDVTAVSTGEEALGETLGARYDLVLLDINLGEGMCGLDVLRDLRGRPSYKEVPVVALTAHALTRHQKQFLDAGFDAYVSKPFSGNTLRSTIDRLLRERAQR